MSWSSNWEEMVLGRILERLGLEMGLWRVRIGYGVKVGVEVRESWGLGGFGLELGRFADKPGIRHVKIWGWGWNLVWE